MAEPVITSILTVNTPAADRSLLTIEELREAVGVSGADEDAALARLGARVAAGIVSACRVRPGGATPATLRSEALTEVFRLGCSTSKLALSRFPVSAIASITEDGTILDAASYELNPASGEVARLSGDEPICWAARKVTVVYTAGWATVPETLALAAQKVAAMLWAEDGRDPNLKRERVEGATELEWWVPPASDPFLSQEIVELLGDYTVQVVP